jgi:LmbE family N-acetylglucosaminyl deacetylase
MLEGGLRRRLLPFPDSDMTKSAVVFAPHPDDETLGCGGTVAKMIAGGASVRFVFVTDGATSHAAISEEELRTRREAEAYEAVSKLGGRADQVEFMRFPDGRAMDLLDALTRAVKTLLDRSQPQIVFIPHASEPPPDHRAVNLAVRAALQEGERVTTVFEYPIWYWYHWPWIPIAGDLPGRWRSNLKQTARTAAGLKALATLNAYAAVGDVLHLKRHALAAHASQMAKPPGTAEWITLGDLGRGEFLRRLLADYEAFNRYQLAGRTTAEMCRRSLLSLGSKPRSEALTAF